MTTHQSPRKTSGGSIALIALFLLLPVWQVRALEKQGRYWVETEEGTVEAGTRLRISTIGPTTVEGGPGQEVRYRAVKKVRARTRAQAENLMREARVTATRQNQSVVISVQPPGCRRCGFQMELHVSAPSSTRRTLIDSLGGSVHVSNLRGRVTVTTEGGPIDVRDIGESVRVSTAGGNITLQSIGGDIHGETAGGSISVRKAGRNATLTTSGGGIAADEVGGTLRAETLGGGITAKNVGGDLIAATAGGSIDLARVSGRIRAETAGGSIRVASATAGVRAETAGGDIRLTGVSGAVVAANAAGNIQAYFVSGHRLRDSVLETSVGNIEVWIPADLKITVRAVIELARSVRRIQSDFPSIRVKLQSDGFGPGSVVAEGTLNGGGPVLRVLNTAGRIKIRRLE